MQFATLHLDTYKVVKLLQRKGYTKKEAEGFIEAIQEITLNGAATQLDISEVQQSIAEVKASIQKTNSDLQDNIKKSIHELYRFQLIQTIALIGVMVALFQYF